MLVHKSCDLGDVSAGERRGVYALANILVSLDPTNTPSGLGGMQFSIANDYGFDQATPYVGSLECYDCGKTIQSFGIEGIESYKLERILDAEFQNYDLEEINND